MEIFDTSRKWRLAQLEVPARCCADGSHTALQWGSSPVSAIARKLLIVIANQTCIEFGIEVFHGRAFNIEFITFSVIGGRIFRIERYPDRTGEIPTNCTVQPGSGGKYNRAPMVEFDIG